jgi:hypothetical protein
MHRIESNRPGDKRGQQLFLDPCSQSATGVEGVADGYTVWLGLASTVRAWGQPKGTGGLTDPHLHVSYRKVKAQVEVEGREYTGSD